MPIRAAISGHGRAGGARAEEGIGHAGQGGDESQIGLGLDADTHIAGLDHERTTSLRRQQPIFQAHVIGRINVIGRVGRPIGVRGGRRRAVVMIRLAIDGGRLGREGRQVDGERLHRRATAVADLDLQTGQRRDRQGLRPGRRQRRAAGLGIAGACFQRDGQSLRPRECIRRRATRHGIERRRAPGERTLETAPGAVRWRHRQGIAEQAGRGHGGKAEISTGAITGRGQAIEPGDADGARVAHLGISATGLKGSRHEERANKRGGHLLPFAGGEGRFREVRLPARAVEIVGRRFVVDRLG